MSKRRNTLHIVNVAQMSDGIVVLFSDGTTSLFHTEFLYEMRNSGDNRVLPRESETEMPGTG